MDIARHDHREFYLDIDSLFDERCTAEGIRLTGGDEGDAASVVTTQARLLHDALVGDPRWGLCEDRGYRDARGGEVAFLRELI